MKRIVCAIVVGLQMILLCACGTNMTDSKDNSTNKNGSSQLQNPKQNIEESFDTKPSKNTYETMRIKALSGMSEKEINILTSTIKKRNEYLER